MEKLSVFVAVPISSCEDGEEYSRLRTNIIELLNVLRREEFQVFCEVEQIVDENAYEPPGDTVRKDFGKIDECQVFVLIHPRKIQTSTLIELGYAYAKEKKIIIVGRKADIPYMAQGFPDVRDNATIIDSETIDNTTINKIIELLRG